MQGISEIVVCFWIRRQQRHGFLENRQCLVETLLDCENGAQCFPAKTVVWPSLNHLPSDCLRPFISIGGKESHQVIDLTLARPGGQPGGRTPSQGIHLCPLQTTTFRLVDGLQRTMRIARGKQSLGIAQPILTLDRIGIQCGFQIGQGRLRLSDLHEQYAQVVVGIRMMRLGLQHQSVQPLGRLKFSGTMLANRLVQRLLDLRH